MDVNVTVWIVAYAIAYHAAKLYDNYKVGYGITEFRTNHFTFPGKGKHNLYVMRT